MTETLIPEGRGKAEAMRTYLARGGGLTRRGGIYRSGPLKGMTQAQAEVDFENKWQTVDGRVKDKYANRANNVLAPSERKIAGVTPSAPSKSLHAPSAVAPASMVQRPAPIIAGVMPAPAQSPTLAAKPPVIPQSSSDQDYATMADQRKATGYQESTRATPFTKADVASATNAGFGPNAAPSGQAPGIAPKVNRATGLPFGYRPGDPLPDGATPAMQASATASVNRQSMIPAIKPAPPKPLSAPAQYSAAQEGYQASQLDPAKAKEMDGIYAGANSEDQATITANSLKRAATLPKANGPQKPMITGITRPKFARG